MKELTILEDSLKEQQAPDWVLENCILLTRTGSHSYGTNTETSDLDYKGIVQPPIEYLLGINEFNQFSSGNGIKGVNDLDYTFMCLHKFVKEAITSAPNNIEMLFTRREDVLKLSPIGGVLLENRSLFLTKQIRNKMGGYARAQIRKLQTKKVNKSGRTHLYEEFGYDTKFASHGVRLLSTAIEALETGTFSTYRPEKERNLILDVRNGIYSLEEVLDMIQELEVIMDTAYKKSPLPSKPNKKKINDLIIQMNYMFLEERKN